MIKIMGAIIIICGSGLFGVYKSYILQKRVRSLKTIEASLNSLCVLIDLKKSPLKDAFLELWKSYNLELYHGAAMTMEKDGAGWAWRNALREQSGILRLSENDLDVLSMLSSGLGKINQANQISQIKYIVSLILENRHVAEEQKKKLVPMYMNMGFLSGAFLVLLLIN